jgi:bacteriorhodopsin
MYVFDIWYQYTPPVMQFASHGATFQWVRYAEWLLTCPVLLIHLSNITGLHEEYSERTMKLLTFDQGTILFGTTAAMSTGPIKIACFLVGLCFGFLTFFTAAKVYIESYHMVPKGKCRRLVLLMAWVYFLSWPLFPVLFLFGPEGFSIISLAGSDIAHCIADLLSKNLWGWLGWYLRYAVRMHILVHGDLRKKTKVLVAHVSIAVRPTGTPLSPTSLLSISILLTTPTLSFIC